jgi:hypothetical protein
VHALVDFLDSQSGPNVLPTLLTTTSAEPFAGRPEMQLHLAKKKQQQQSARATPPESAG